MCKKLVCIMLMVCMISIGFGAAQDASATTSDWTSGQSWSYKWEMSFADIIEGMEQSMFSDGYPGMYDDMSIDFWASGGMVQMLTVTYNGNNHFSYTGGTYGEGKFGYAISGSFEGVSGSSEMKLNINKLDSDFSGTFDVVEAEYTDYWSEQTYYYYGITNQTITSTGNMDMSVTAEYEMSGEGVEEETQGSGGMSIVTTWTLDLSITYTPALPWMAKTIPVDVGKTVTADYNGSIDGHVKTTCSGIFAEMGTENIDESVSESLDSSETLWINLESCSPTVKKPSPILGAANVGSGIMSSKASYGTPSILSGIETESTGEFNDDDTSYTSLTMSSDSTSDATSMFGSMPGQNTTSTTATAGDVTSFLSNKGGYFNSCDFPAVGHEPGAGEEDNLLWIIIGVIGIVAAVVIVSVALIARRRRKKMQPVPYAPQYPQQPYPPQPYQPQQPYQPYQQPQPVQPQQTQYQPSQPTQQVYPQYQPTPQPSPATEVKRTIKCPFCGTPGKVVQFYKGKIRCPACKNVFDV